MSDLELSAERIEQLVGDTYNLYARYGIANAQELADMACEEFDLYAMGARPGDLTVPEQVLKAAERVLSGEVLR